MPFDTLVIEICESEITTFAIAPAWPVTMTLYRDELAMFAQTGAVAVGAGGATLFFPIIPVSVVDVPFAVRVAVTVMVPSGKPLTLTLVPNLPVAPITPLPEVE